MRSHANCWTGKPGVPDADPSAPRGEATPDNDLDLLVDVERSHGYFDMAGFALGVEDELGVMTQVATLHGLKLPIRDRVLQEAVAL